MIETYQILLFCHLATGTLLVWDAIGRLKGMDTNLPGLGYIAFHVAMFVILYLYVIFWPVAWVITKNKERGAGTLV